MPTPKEFTDKIKAKLAEAPAAPVAEEAAAVPPQPAEVASESNFGSQLGEALGGLLPRAFALGVGGSDSYNKQVSAEDAIKKAAADNLAQAKKDKAEADKFAFEIAKEKRAAGDAQTKFGIERFDSETKRMDLGNKNPTDFAGKLNKLNSSDKARFDHVRSAYQSLQDINKALNKGDATFSPVGDNDYTLNARLLTEAIGRMQSGGAINKDEEARFVKLLPRWNDSTDIQKSKLAMLDRELSQRFVTLGFNANEVPGIDRSAPYGGTVQGGKTALASDKPAPVVMDANGNKYSWDASTNKYRREK